MSVSYSYLYIQAWLTKQKAIVYLFSGLGKLYNMLPLYMEGRAMKILGCYHVELWRGSFF